MNNAINLNLKTTPLVDVPQITPVTSVTLIQNNQEGELAEVGNEFLELLNAELEVLVDSETLDLVALSDSDMLENIEEVEDITDFSPSSSVLAELLLKDEDSIEQLGIVGLESLELTDENIHELEEAFKVALSELPKEVISLPLTPENKDFIVQQALARVKVNNPEIIAQIKQADGQVLSLEGKMLPLVEEVLVKQNTHGSVQVASLNAPALANMVLGKENISEASAKESSLEFLAESDSEIELEKNFKSILVENDKNSTSLKDKPLVEVDTIVNKTAAQSDVIPQKFNTEAVSTALNNIMGANQASINTPTASAVQSGSTLLLPQNPTPEQWGSALGDKVQYMINTKLDSAEIRIDPPHLGKMDISIKMTDDGANVVIQTQHAATRELVDAASYRLKEMLEQSGHENVDVDVSHKENHESDNQFAQGDELNDQESSVNIGSDGTNEVTDSDVLAGTYTNGRPRLDLFV